MERKIQQRTIESRKKLLDAAYHLFAEKGYYNTNTKEIARYAGISIGNFYNYYQDKCEIYCALLEVYIADSCRAMQELTDKLAELESRSAYQDFLLSYMRQLLNRTAGTKKFFDDSVVIARESTLVQSILSRAEKEIIAILEMFLKKRYPNRQDDFYTRARMIYVITDQVAKDILCVESVSQREDYIQIFVNEIIHLSFDQ
ncbi:TetR/AcrR family transcriptional regulator [Murimonas intestini]|uniref:TetR/AcrR family transcriptional regulator n=1 Tax=Murimonas intestini TaxID=1337051 RepID=UPI001651E9BD|nr:TetR/AcrR family transcriptional regulator [Murimonas intestini]